MPLPEKHDRLSASVSAERQLNGVRCEIACYGNGNDFVCRITRWNAKPTDAEWCDGYHPPPDGGVLWIRAIGGQCLITGFVQEELFRNGDELHEELEAIQQLLPVDQGQAKLNVTVLARHSIKKLEFNGEQVDTTYT